MLQKVRSIWVEGLLEQSLAKELRIALDLTDQPDAVDLPLNALVQELRHPPRELPAGTPLTEAFRRQTHTFLDTLEQGSLDDLTVVPRLVAGSSALRERLFLGWEREIEVLAPVLAERAGVPEDDLVARVVARSLAWAHRLVFRAALEGLVAGRPRAELAAELRVQADRAYDQLEQGLAGY